MRRFYDDVAQDGASKLFISSRPVEHHLGKVFTKLGISARRDLRRIVPQDA